MLTLGIQRGFASFVLRYFVKGVPLALFTLAESFPLLRNVHLKIVNIFYYS